MAILRHARLVVATLASVIGAAGAACSLTHQLDDIHATYDASAHDAAFDAAADAIDAPPDGAIPAYCMDGQKDFDETDVDCGGSCYPCVIGKLCAKDGDCSTYHCEIIAVDAGADAGDAMTPSAGSRCRCPAETVQGDRPPGGAHGDGSFCIAKTEVTVADYMTFTGQCDAKCRMDAFASLTNGRCDPNASILPDTSNGSCVGYRTAQGALPVACVDWCDAYAYCAWRGWRLCGDFGDGPTPISMFANAARSEWYNACSFNGVIDVPYGGVYDRNACNGERDAGVVASNTTFPNCTAAYSTSLFDLSGNVYEWENSCNDGDDTCHARGGAYYSTEPELHCSGFGNFPRATVDVGVGIRCCLGY